MPFDRPFGHEESFSDRSVGVALGYEPEDLELSLGERCVGCGRCLGGCAQRKLLQLDGAALEIGRGALERLLREFGICDVLDDRDDADRFAGVVDNDLAVTVQRADSAAGTTAFVAGLSYKVAPGARAACAFVSAAANRGLPPFVAERYSVRARLRPLPEWFGVDPLDLELRDAPGRGTGEFSIEHVAEGFRLWVQLALLDALEDAARVESFLLRLASHWRGGAETASQMYALEDEDAEVADSNADQLWEQFDTAVDELLDLEVADPGWLSGELADFLAEAPEDDWTKSRGRTGRLVAGSA